MMSSLKSVWNDLHFGMILNLIFYTDWHKIQFKRTVEDIFSTFEGVFIFSK